MRNERFARHQLIPGWRQDRLRDATVVVAGVGALGNEVTRILAMSGVGRLILCDHDRVEASNLSRTVLFRDADVGKPKVLAAARALEELAPGCEVDPRPLPLIHGVGLAELREASLVLGCLDSRSARLQLAGRANLVRAPSIDGGTRPWGGEVRLCLDSAGACYGCSLAPEDRGVADVAWSCLDSEDEEAVGAAAPSSALVGAWIAQMAVRFLMGLDIENGLLAIDAERGTTRRVELRRDPECPLHDPIEDATAIIDVSASGTVGELLAALGDADTPLAWEPFLERVECPSCGLAEERWGPPDSVPCPRCGVALRPRTTLELGSAPEDLTLSALGVASREILAVRGPGGIQWVELTG